MIVETELYGFERHLESSISDKLNVWGGMKEVSKIISFFFFFWFTYLFDGSTHWNRKHTESGSEVSMRWFWDASVIQLRFYSIGLTDGKLKPGRWLCSCKEWKECCILKTKGKNYFKKEALIHGVERSWIDEVERVLKPQGCHSYRKNCLDRVME